MIIHYIKIAWRGIVRNKLNSSLNITGLAIGMASFILILLYVQDELKYDKFLDDSERIYQVALNTDFGGEEIFIGKTPASVSPALARNFPEIENAARVYRPGDIVLKSSNGVKENFFTESSVLAVDSNFLDIFSFAMLEGNRNTCLQQPNSIVITEEVARKYFGSVPAMGKTMYMDKENIPLTVTGILKTIPSQSTLSFDILTSTSAFPIVKKMSWSWIWLQVCTYVKLKPTAGNSPVAIRTLENKFPAMINAEAAPAFKQVGKPLDELLKKGGKWNLHLQPFTDIHLHSAGIGQIMQTVSDIKYVYIFSVIAFFIILLACINFMNLSTAQAAKRAKEVGVRKVLGSGKKELIKQFLSEAILFSLSAFVFAIFLVTVFIGPFNQVSGKALALSLLFKDSIWLYMLSLVAVTGIVAGSYPAFYLSSFKPAVVIKGTTQSGFRDFFIRNSLVVFQFTVSTALIICSLVVFQQLDFMQNKDIGLNKENIFIIANSERLDKQQESFRQELIALPEIAGASIASGIPTRENFGDGYIPEPSSAQDKLVESLGLSSFMVDEDFIPSLNIKLLQGRNFSRDFSDSGSVILNEEAVKQIGWKNPVGSFITYPGNNNQRFKVIGVVKDFNINSLHSTVAPFALFNNASKTYDLGTSYIVIKNKSGKLNEALKLAKEKWLDFAPSLPFDYMFLDNEFEALYKTEHRTGNVLFIFTSLSIFIACLGLFGLAVFTAERRTREIGIRKVLGASVSALVALLSKDFMKMVFISGLIALPLAWYAMNKWLEDFAYHITIGVWVFIAATGSSQLIALLTVSIQTIKASIANPVKSLRNE
jgi:putative ABC transport system permease protein